jgi:serine/threonine protein kinase
MQTLAPAKKMLYCPKCQHQYEEGTQRFCVTDGVRLHPQKLAQNSNETVGVFSGLLNKNVIPEKQFELKPQPPKIIKPIVSEFKEKAKEISKNEPPRTFSKLIKPNEIPSGQAPLGDRRANPVGRVALSADNPNILLGQTIKGRYFIKSRLSQTAHGIKYLGTDNINSDKKVIVRIYTGRLDGNDFSAKIFADERVALSHINHPNIAKVIDSGELPEGNPFIVSEQIKGISLKESFARNSRFDRLRTARIIRKSANAVSEAHQNGVLHRNLNPENVVLSTNEAGTEQVKITDFNIFSDKSRGDFSYLAPEQITGNTSNYSSDIYSLSVIAFQMLTGKMPFEALTSRELLKIQQQGLQAFETETGTRISNEIEAVLQKALAFNPSARFQSIRDFGDAFYNSITAEIEDWSEPESSVPAFVKTGSDDFAVSLDSVLDETAEENKIEKRFVETTEIETEKTDDFNDIEIQKVFENDSIELEIEKPFHSIKFHDVGIGKNEQTDTADEKSEAPWERRSIEPPVEGGQNWNFLAIGGIFLLFILTAGIFYYFVNRPAEPKFAETATPNQNIEKTEPSANTANQTDINEIPPPPRTEIEQPPNTVFFENSKENLSRELLKYYRNFSLYYPKDWKKNKFDKERNKIDDKFIDISKSNAEGVTIEQFMVSYYESNGTFDLDKEQFPEIVRKASDDIKNSPLPNFELVGQGLVNLNKTDGYDGWKAYEMKFQGEGRAMNGDKIKLWGRRFYIPAARPGVKKGLVVTLLATSLSTDIKSADDLGAKGDLKTILYTFEPDQNF